MSLSVGNAALLPGRNLIGSEWREAALGAVQPVADRTGILPSLSATP
ncbi:hypothetical protein OMF39_16025 [Bordetella pertussis]